MSVLFAKLAGFAKPTYILRGFYQSAHSQGRIGERTVSRYHRSKGGKEIEWWLRKIEILGFGDADPSNVSPLVHGAEMRVAETRAVNRALRKAYGIGICSIEEIGSQQVEHFIHAGGASRRLDPHQLASNYGQQIEITLARADACWDGDSTLPLLVYSTAESEAVQAVHAGLGPEQSGELVENALSAVVRGLVARGVGQLIVAGGETAGVCTRALDIQKMQIGPQIDPGVPWCYATSTERSLHLALKSGNFGSPDFFSKAFALIQ